jgi:hypothetical protein
MERSVAEKLNGCMEGLRSALDNYARLRKTKNVGEFFDDAGASDAHWGIYGVSDWILLESLDPSRQRPEEAAGLLGGCRSLLKDLVGTAHAKTLDVIKSEETPDRQSQNYELRFVVPKMVYAFEALDQDSETASIAQEVLNDLIDCQNAKDGSWPMCRDRHYPNTAPIATALVLRALKGKPQCVASLRKALDFLNGVQESMTSVPIQRLFVLNTIYMVAPDLGRHALLDPTRKRIDECVRAIFGSLRGDYFFLANPMNLDFHDIRGVRFFRLPSDLIVLESLILLSGHSLVLVQVSHGKKLLDKFFNMLGKRTFTYDTSGHRASAGTYAFVRDILNWLNRREYDKHLVPDRWRGVYRGLFTFGVIARWDVILFLVFAVLTISAWGWGRVWLPAANMTGIFLSAAATVIIEIFSRQRAGL